MATDVRPAAAPDAPLAFSSSPAQHGDRAKFGYEEYCCFPNDGRRHEVIDGDHYVNPAPSTYHQTVSRRLQYQLYTQIELAGKGVVYDAPVDVQITDHDIVQPDLVVVLAPRTQMITPTKIKGVPDLIVEILSPSTASNDLSLKKRLYERMGVAEYWIADPDNHTLCQFVLADGCYEQRPPGDEIRLSILDTVAVRLADVW
ncbi:MAG: Uma2 family endonuclease [Pirellulales bacterium]